MAYRSERSQTGEQGLQPTSKWQRDGTVVIIIKLNSINVNFLYQIFTQVTTQLSSQGWLNPVLDLISLPSLQGVIAGNQTRDLIFCNYTFQL